MKKHIAAALVLAGVVVSAAGVNAASFEVTRRTLHAYVNETPLAFEAPKGMCFYDKSDFAGGALHDLISASLADHGTMIGIFTDCDNIVNPRGEADEPPLFGHIFAMKPLVLQSRTETRESFLTRMADDYAATVAERLAAEIEKNGKDKGNPFRQKIIRGKAGSFISTGTRLERFELTPLQASDQAVVVGYATERATEDGKSVAYGVEGVTMIKGIPVMVLTTRGKGTTADREARYAQMADFINAQLALNGGR